jgi:hypothetical protein
MRIIIKPTGLLIILALLSVLGFLAFRKSKPAPTAMVATPAAVASARPTTATGANLLKPTDDPANWQTEQIDGAALRLGAGSEGELQVTIQKGSKDDWKLKIFQAGLDLPEGATVHLHYKARTVPAQSLKVWADAEPGAGQEYRVIWKDWGESRSYTTEWQDYDFSFVAEKPTPGHSRAPVFPLGNATGTIYLKDATLTVER